MDGAFDDVALERAFGEARRGVGAFVVGDIKRAADIEDREPPVIDIERPGAFRRDVGLRANPHN